MKRALLVSLDRYPNGDAGAVRTHIFAKLLIELGYEPVVVGMGSSTNLSWRKYENISYCSLRSSSCCFLANVFVRLFLTRRLVKVAFSLSDQWDLILFSGIPKRMLRYLKRYSVTYHVPIVHDSVEWYSPEQFPFGKLHPVYRAKDRLNRRLLDEKVKLISISTYLQNHFESRGLSTVRIPVIMDVKAMRCFKRIQEDKIVLLYAGSPGKKDYLKTIISGAAHVKSNINFELRLLGIRREQLIDICDAHPQDIELLGDKLMCMGRVSRDKVLEQLEEADYTVLIRSEEQRYAKAGFPTKFVESLATATPVITNLSSDLGMYMKDGQNGFIVENETAEALAQAIERALSLTIEQRKAIQTQARCTAEENFDWHNYIDAMTDLLMEDKTI